MYANRSSLPFGINPAGFGGAMVVNGLVVVGLLFFLAPNILPREAITTLTGRNIIDPPPPPPIPEPKPKPQPEEMKTTQIVVPETPVKLPDTPPIKTTTDDVTSPHSPDLGTPAGTADTPRVEVKPDPPLAPLIGATLDPRYAGSLQPEYPSSEQRLQREGSVTVRVLIGTDGRVKDVQQVSATSQAFFDATKRQAMRAWRFKPATRGGVPQESWKQQTVRFTLADGQ